MTDDPSTKVVAGETVEICLMGHQMLIGRAWHTAERGFIYFVGSSPWTSHPDREYWFSYGAVFSIKPLTEAEIADFAAAKAKHEKADDLLPF